MKFYGSSNANPKGTPEDPTRCIVAVWRNNGWDEGQCTRKRGHGEGGLYCKQHADQHARLKAIREGRL